MGVDFNKRFTSVGKNLFDGELESGSINTTTGLNEASISTLIRDGSQYTFTTAGTFRFIRTKGYIKIKPATTYTFQLEKVVSSTSDDPYMSGMLYYDIDKNYISEQGNVLTGPAGIRTTTFTTPSNAHYIRFRLANAIATTSIFKNPQLEQGSTAQPTFHL